MHAQSLVVEEALREFFERHGVKIEDNSLAIKASPARSVYAVKVVELPCRRLDQIP